MVAEESADDLFGSEGWWFSPGQKRGRFTANDKAAREAFISVVRPRVGGLGLGIESNEDLVNEYLKPVGSNIVVQ
jgi:hypothetical protein